MKKTFFISCLCSILFVYGATAQSTAPKVSGIIPGRDTSALPLIHKILAIKFFKKNITEKTEALSELMKEIPDTGTTALAAEYDLLRSDIAMDYMKAGDKHTGLLWMDSLRTKEGKIDANTRIGRFLLSQDGKGEASAIEQRLRPFVDSVGSIFRKNGSSREIYGDLMPVYVKALLVLGKQDRVAYCLQPLYAAEGKKINSDLRERSLTKPENYKLTDNLSYDYGMSLAATGHPKEAIDVLARIYLTGEEVSGTIQANIKEECLKIPGGEVYFQHITDSVRQSDQAKFIGFVANKKDADGKPIDVKSLKGKYVLIDFWGSWCRPCRATHPHLKELYAKYKEKGFEIVGVSTEVGDTPEERHKLWTDAIKMDGLTWLQVLDNENVEKFNAGKEYAIIAYPTKILLDREGNIIGRYVGNGPGGMAFTYKLEELFGK